VSALAKVFAELVRGVEMIVKHATASAFVFGRFPAGWRLGLIDHPRLGRWMIMGGHVERDESQEQAVLREVGEESGLSVRLINQLTVPLPVGYPHPRVAQPWWINEMPVPADNHLPVAHIHIDHQYVAVADDPTPRAAGVHAFGWHSAEELVDLPMFEDTRLLAGALFSCVEQIVAGGVDAGALLRPFAAAAG
jgi:8-oxo-dGTP pyrophosphatase MutT (NUDIX family)